VGPVKTSPDYELYTLDTVRPKPRLVATRSDGGSIAGELWLLSPANLGRLLIDLPAPMMLGRGVRLYSRSPGIRHKHHRVWKLAELFGGVTTVDDELGAGHETCVI
jgi:hypothetical protein